MKLLVNVTDDEISSMFPQFIFEFISMETVFGVILGKCLYLAFRKYKKHCHILEIILVQGFCTLITEIDQLPIGIHLKLYQETFLVCKKNDQFISASLGKAWTTGETNQKQVGRITSLFNYPQWQLIWDIQLPSSTSTASTQYLLFWISCGGFFFPQPSKENTLYH